MKHLLNDLTEEEKNIIRMQYSGGMKVMSENFNRLINYKSGDVKQLLEQPDSRLDTAYNREFMRKHARQASTLKLTMDDVVDIVSALIEGIPGVGQLVSAGIDVSHAFTYLIRFFLVKETDKKIEYGAMTILTLGSAYLPVAGNLSNMTIRQFIKHFLSKTPDEVLKIAKKLGLYDKTAILLKKEKWRYSLMMLLVRILGDEFIEVISNFLVFLKTKIKSEIKKVPYVGDKVIPAVNFMIEFLEDVKEYSDILPKLAGDVKPLVNEQTTTKEQSSPVRIGCHDYDKIGQLCSTLVFPKDEADKLISKFKPNADKKASEEINYLVQSLTSMGGEEGKRIAQKFSEAIESTKGQIQKILTKYYSQAMYASCGLGPKLNASPIILEICGVIYSQFIKSWNDNFFMRNVASLAINKNNIKEVQSEGKDILSSVIDAIVECLHWYFQDSTFNHSIDRVRELEKTSPKCTKVIVTQDRGCNNLPKEKWYNPTQKYKNIHSPIIYGNAHQLAIKTYSPKLVEFLNNLV